MRLILIALISLFGINCSQQTKHIAWLPEKYISAISTNDSLPEKFLSPIEGFELINDTLFILTFKGELTPLKMKKVIIDNKTKNHLLDLQYFINMKYNSKELVAKMANASIYMTNDGDKLKIEIINKDSKETIYFINNYNGINFEDIKRTKKYFEGN